jgi:hypothetical protein
MSSPGRRSVATLSALAALAALAAGLAASGASPSAFDRMSTRQSRPASERPAGPTVDFVAVQADGTPVVDLLSSEVEVRINDRVRVVRSLRRVTTAPAPIAPGKAPRVPPPYGTNASVSVGRSFALVIDQESFAGREPLLRNAVEGLLTQLTPADRTMIVALPYGGVRMPFTSETARIRLAMEGVSGQGSRNETGSQLACRTREFLEALDGFLRNHADRLSPLTVVVFTAGLAAPRRDAPMALGPGMCELRVEDFQRVTVAAGAAHANFYVAQPADIGMSAAAWRETIAGVGYLGSDNPLEGIEHLAGATNGARVPLDGTGTGSLLRVARESSAFYVAELEPERGEVYGRSRSLAVRVARRDVTVRARQEITFVDEPRRTAMARLTVTDLLVSRDAFTDLPLRAAGFTVREPDGRLRVGVVVEPVEAAASLDSVGAVLVDADGRIVARWFAAETIQRPLLGAMTAPPGTYRLRVAAIDRAGRPGVAENDVEVRLTPVGPLSLGSLMLGISRNQGVWSRLEFGVEPTAIASFDIYGGLAGMRVTATLEVARDPDGPALVTLPLALTRADDSRVVATGAVPLGALPPGDYVVRGIIRLEDGTTGRVICSLRKVARQE